MGENNIIEGTPLSEEEEFWMTTMRQMTADSIKSVEEAAKQLVAMITVMQGVYAAVLAFSGINEAAKAGGTVATVLYVLPILLWLVSLFFALRVFKTRKYDYYANSPDSSKDVFRRIVEYKYRGLNVAYGFMCGSFLVVVVGIVYWVRCFL